MTDESYLKLPPKWVVIAMSELGVAEVPGPKNNPRILEYDSTTTLGAKDDFVPWCSAFVCWVMELYGAQSTRSAEARSWLEWGVKAQALEVGNIVVFSRGTNPKQGHVGFLLDWDSTQLYILGGNQEDRVSIRTFRKTSVLAQRRPATLIKPVVSGIE